MKCGLLPRGMWLVFQKSFRRQLCLITREDPQAVMKEARITYRSILLDIPDFDKGDRFLVNILSAAMLAAVYLNLREKPELSAITEYYHKAMTENTVMKHFLKHSDSYSEKTQAKLAWQAAASQTRKNPYSWKFRYEPGTDRNSYSCYFDTCGIWHLFQTLGIPEITPAMWTYDYDMAELSGSVFTRQNTLAGGGPCCDCHYQKKA